MVNFKLVSDNSVLKKRGSQAATIVYSLVLESLYVIEH